jgi:hypothetical protein
MSSESSLLSSAVVVWTGWGEAASPAREQARLVKAFGEERAARLLGRMLVLEDEFAGSDPEQFREAHPELSDGALQALAWSSRSR